LRGCQRFQVGGDVGSQPVKQFLFVDCQL
jgi:hypothetical protein